MAREHLGRLFPEIAGTQIFDPIADALFLDTTLVLLACVERNVPHG